MLRNVLEQRLLLRKAFVTRITFERLVRLVATRMTLQIAELRERFGTVGVPTLVRLLPGMRAHVLLQMRELRELTLTYLALVGFDAEMDARMLTQVRTICEGFAALGTFVRLHLAHVHRGM